MIFIGLKTGKLTHARGKLGIALIFLAFALSSNSSLTQNEFAFIPFEDISNFKGKWDLKIEIPRYLGDFIWKFYGVEILPVDSVIKVAKQLGFGTKDAFLFSELNKRFGIKRVIGGKILTFKVSRFMTGFPLMAGYESYSAEVEIEIEVFDALTGEREVIFGVVSEIKDRGLGLTLLGKQTERYSEFYSLDFLKFGSSEFNETIVGEAMKKAGREFALRLKRYFLEIVTGISEQIPDKFSGATELESVVVEGEVIVIGKQDLIYVNLGRKDGIFSGMVLYVFEDKKKVGEIEVVDVIEERLSSCRIVNSIRELRKGDKVKARVIK